MSILFLNWKTIRFTSTFKNEHPQKNSVINPMRIQIFEKRWFCTQQLPSEKNSKFTFSTWLSERRKRRKTYGEHEKREE